jgi:translation initiation factor IF-3
MRLSQEAELDLVEVSPTADPPVCRIMDYGKWLYEQKRKIRENAKKHSHSVGTLKEIRLRPETDPHDLTVKVNHAREFLQKGHKVQFTVFFRGRQMLHQEKGFEVANSIVQQLEEVSKVERPAAMTGRRIILMLIPK